MTSLPLLEIMNYKYDISPAQARTVISIYHGLGYVLDDHLIVLNPKQQIKSYRIIDYDKGTYEPIDNDNSYVIEAISWYQGA